jgi:hypothetical protein
MEEAAEGIYTSQSYVVHVFPLSPWERVRVRGFFHCLGLPHPYPLPEGKGANAI